MKPAKIIMGYDPGAPRGDVTIVSIDPHTLYCADAYELRPRLGFFDAEVMDPPYLFKASGGGAFRKSREILNQIVEEGLDQGFDIKIINPLLSGSLITFCHNDQLPELLPYPNGSFHRFAVCFWRKLTPLPMANKHYRPDLEIYIHAWNRGYHPQGALVDRMRVVESRSRRDRRSSIRPSSRPSSWTRSCATSRAVPSSIPSWAPAAPASPRSAPVACSPASKRTRSTSRQPSPASPPPTTRPEPKAHNMSDLKNTPEGSAPARVPLGALLRRPEVERETGLSRSTIYERMDAGTFPLPLRVGPRAVRWPANEIEAWKAAQPVVTRHQ